MPAHNPLGEPRENGHPALFQHPVTLNSIFMAARLIFLLCLAVDLEAATRLVVTVVETKSGRPVTDLKAQDFTLSDDKKPLRIEDAEFAQSTIDVMLLLDTSLLGQIVQPMAENLIGQLQPKEQMAIVAYHSSADLIQDFTSSRQLLARAVAKVKYGNTPHVLDALYAAIDSGFQGSSFRRIIVLVTAGVEGRSRVNEQEVIRLARRNGVSIFPVYMMGNEKMMFELLSRQTGGAFFNLKDMKKAGDNNPGARIFEVLRGHYTLTVTGNLRLGEKLKVEVKRPEKLFASALPVE
jgi:VWFA-related protein